MKTGMKMDLRELLRKVEAAPNGTPELDSEFASVFPSTPRKVTRSIDAAVRLIESELPGWWWTCGHCTLSDDASLCRRLQALSIRRSRNGAGLSIGP
jgi:hypothetical protein